MPYVQREDNVIVGVFANLQPGFAEEWLEDDDTEVVGFLTPPSRLPDLLPYQFRAMLALSGNVAALNAYIDGLEDPAKTIARAKLDYSLSFRRDNDLVEQARQALGLTNEQLDALWTQAAAIA